ncbi:hypothetical protein BJX70DRAFT_390569 [Aspergillus crustosus]
MLSDEEIWISCQAGSVTPAPFLAAPHVLSVVPMMNRPRAQTAGSTTQRLGNKMSSSIVSFYYRDGIVGSVEVRDKRQVIDTRKKLLEDGWMVMRNQTFFDSTVEQRQIEHNDAVKQFLRVDEGTYIPRRFRKREVDATNSLFVPSSGTSDLQIINVLHLGGGTSSSWIFEYYTPNDSLRKCVSLRGTDIIFVAGWMKDWRIPYMHGQAGLLAEIVYVQQRFD